MRIGEKVRPIMGPHAGKLCRVTGLCPSPYKVHVHIINVGYRIMELKNLRSEEVQSTPLRAPPPPPRLRAPSSRTHHPRRILSPIRTCWSTLATHDELSVCLLPHGHFGPHEWTFAIGQEPVYFGA